MKITKNDIGREGLTRAGYKVPMERYKDGLEYPAEFADEWSRTDSGMFYIGEESPLDIIAWADEQPVKNTDNQPVNNPDKLAELEARIAELEGRLVQLVEQAQAEAYAAGKEAMRGRLLHMLLQH